MADAVASLYADPNRFARPASLELGHHSAVFHGYQEFLLTRHALRVLPEDEALGRKRHAVLRWMNPRLIAGRTILDIGANGGFFTFWALLNDARSAVALDMDDRYLAMITQARDALGYDSLSVANANITEWEEPADVVIALALIHWIFACTAAYGTLDAAVGKLAALTREMLIIEWVDPADPAINSFGHLRWEPELVAGPYDRETFEAALSKHFARWQRGDDVTSTRTLYAAFRSEFSKEARSPLPLLHDASSVISSRRLTVQQGIEYWSTVYDVGDAIVKQTTFDLAEREAAMLDRLAGPLFPRVLDTRSEDAFSVVRLEKIEGDRLSEATIEPIAFTRACIDILSALQVAGIEHRDIRADNVIVRDGLPVLIDFGWACTRDSPGPAPRSLGGDSRPKDGGFDDVYSMGILLRSLDLPPRLRTIAELMSDEMPALRMRRLPVLRDLVEAVAESGA